MSKIVKIEKTNYRGWVYGIDIEEDKSFVANGIVVHNCEKGMNQGSAFDLIKSEITSPTLDSILASFKDELSPFSGAQIYVENSGEIPSVIIKADKYNSIVDMLVLELQKMLSENTPVVVKYDVSDAIPVYKMQLVPIWTTPQIQREAKHSFPAKLGEDVIIKESDKSYEEESEEINESKKTEKARNSHKFIAAEWTHKNGHPRCKICGMEEGMTKICPGLDKENYKGETQNMGRAIDVFKSWLKKEKELDSPGRKVLHNYEGRASKLRQLLDEQGMPEDEDPKDADKRRDEEILSDNPQPWLENEGGQDEELTPSEKAKVRGKHKIERFDN